MHTFINTLLYISAQFAATMLNTSQKNQMFKFTWHKIMYTINKSYILVAVQHRLKELVTVLSTDLKLSRADPEPVNHHYCSALLSKTYDSSEVQYVLKILNISTNISTVSLNGVFMKKRIIQFSLCVLLDVFDFWGTHTDRHIFFFLYLSNRKWKLIHGRIYRSGNGNDQALNSSSFVVIGDFCNRLSYLPQIFQSKATSSIWEKEPIDSSVRCRRKHSWFCQDAAPHYWFTNSEMTRASYMRMWRLPLTLIYFLHCFSHFKNF